MRLAALSYKRPVNNSKNENEMAEKLLHKVIQRSDRFWQEIVLF